MSAWLAAQGYDAKKRSAAKLQTPCAQGFAAAAAGTYVELLSEQFPELTIVDTVFPDDPRYPSHIIKRP